MGARPDDFATPSQLHHTPGRDLELCKELFDPQVVDALWNVRDRIAAIRIISWEPYVPWECLRLYNPKTGEPDSRFLAEYGLVRGLADGDTPPRVLGCRSLRFIVGDYPCGTEPAVGAEERAFLSGETPNGLRSLGFEVTPAPPTLEGFLEALRSDVDCLHICCHAAADHRLIEASRLILGDFRIDGDAYQIVADPSRIAYEMNQNLYRKRPIVFLNACETGRLGPTLTREGGWPAVFLRAGAGVFVGTSWPVGDLPATRFAQAFYSSLSNGKTLAEASNAARDAARMPTDASWLAFKVYGDPHARRADVT